MTSELLKEAIADAKAVRATAIANAKLALEEAFTPRLQSMLGQKLREELDENELEESSDDTTENITSEEVDEMLKELDVEKADENAAPAATVAADPTAAPVAADPAAAPAAAAPAAAAPAAAAPAVADPAAAAPAAAPAVVAPAVAAPAADPAADPAAAPAVAAPAVAAPAADPAADPAAAPAIDSKTVSESDDSDEVDLEELLAEINEMDVDSMTEEDDGMTEENDSMTEVDLDELLAELNKEGDTEHDEDDDTKTSEAVKSELNEALKTVEFLKTQLNEVNLLNAKLLYTNKLFKAHALDNNQKMKIIEAFDLTKSVREVKLTYNNLSEALNLSKVKTAPKKSPIAEGFASNTTGTTKPVQAEKSVISESVNGQVSRFQKLAGIKK